MKSSALTTETTVVAVDDALSTTIDGETVILHPDVGKYYGLNEVGTFVWELLQEPRSVDELCREVVDAYEVDRDRCRSDVEDLLVELVEKDLVRLTDA
ncbi:PqqD family protein [Halorubrum sp. SD690R]|uniref:PqqD family protein n=1 Tax=Halorubrum sp. SD690R TaxID=2518117 RepID=UPI0010F534D6|nr:PqqD family protein [Halorubrum sp. SD690R]TKX47228.1 PqqD family protein [Halorubrum sp. SD690R]